VKKKKLAILFVAAVMFITMTGFTALAQPPVTLNPADQQMYDFVRDNYMGNMMNPTITPQAPSFNFAGVENVHMHSWLTGEMSPSQTRTQFGVSHTDLGFPVVLPDGDVLYIFGDTFLREPSNDFWRSNFIARTSDDDITDGITFDSVWEANNFVTQGHAGAFIPGGYFGINQNGHWEVTTIPTGGFVIDDTIYVSYMSVEWWGPGGVWAARYGSMVKSTDDGNTWTDLYSAIKWQGDIYPNRPIGEKIWPSIYSSGFEQSHPIDGGDGYIYFFGLSGGRFTEAKLMRAAYANIENQAEYEFLVGYEADGSPIWETYANGGIGDAIPVIEGGVGEMSIMYSYYLEEWLITYFSTTDFNTGIGDLMVISAKNLWGEFSEPQVLVYFEDIPTLYGAFMIPNFQSADCSKFYFVMSIWGTPLNNFAMDLYNSFIMAADLIRSGDETCDDCNADPCECPEPPPPPPPPYEECDDCGEYPCECDEAPARRWYPSLPENRFDDVPDHPHWQNNPVSWADRNGITRGIAGTTPLEFRPNRPLTREMLATFMHRIADRPEAEEASTFTDSGAVSTWAVDAVNWAAEIGVIEGFTDGSFRPRTNITREQMALMLFRYAEIIEADTEFTSTAFDEFPDVDMVSSWATDAMRWATYHGIIAGQRGNMAPHSDATRAEAVTMLQRFVDTFEVPPPSWVEYTG